MGRKNKCCIELWSCPYFNDDGRYSFTFQKVSGLTGLPLSSAVFELRQGNQVISSARSNLDGSVNFFFVPTGEYTLVETTVPNGYLPNPNTYTVNVVNSRVITIDGIKSYLFTVENTPETTAREIVYDPNNMEGNDPYLVNEEVGNIHTVRNNMFTSPLEFLYWNTESDGSGISYFSGNNFIVDNNLRLYAIWKSRIPLINDIYEGDIVITGSGIPGSLIETIFQNGEVARATVNSNGYWDAIVPSTSLPLIRNELIKVYQTEVNRVRSDEANTLVLPKENHFQVIYYSNDSSGQAFVQEVIGGDIYTILNDMFHTTPNFEFWNAKADGSGTSYLPGDTIVVNQNIKLYAFYLSKSAVPILDIVIEGSFFVSGQGIPGSIVTVIFPNDSSNQTTVEADGHWLVIVPSGALPLVAYTTIEAVQIEAGKSPSDIVTTTVIPRV